MRAATASPTRSGRVVMTVFFALLVGGACSDGDGPQAKPESTSERTVTSERLRRCQPPTPVNPSPAGFEARGTGTDVTAWALLYEVPPWKVDKEVKVVWRMAGTGDFRVVASDHRGDIVDPLSGTTPHSGSNWERPGDEWGTFFALPSPGCWTLEASRGNSISRVFVLVEG